MFKQHFNRAHTMREFPYFVPEEESEYNLDYAKHIVEEQIIPGRWREDVERGGWKRHEAVAKRIAAHVSAEGTAPGGLILEICAGPGGGFTPAVLMCDYSARICMSDLCPTVLKEWHKHFAGMDNPPPNVEFAALDVCDLPFADNSLEVVCGSAAVINIEGDRDKALREIYRVLKPGGLFAFDYIFVTEEDFTNMPSSARETIKERYPTAFWDALGAFDALGYARVEEVSSGMKWNNKDDDSTLADLCRSLGTSLDFSGFIRYCIK